MSKSVLVAVIAILALSAVGVYLLMPPQGEQNGEIPNEPVGEMPEEQTVLLYYYNPEKDKDASGNVLCSRQGLEGVEREIRSEDPVDATLRLLLEGNLTAEEREQGITTEYPLEGFSLTDTTLENGVLTLTFQDLQNKSVGGACRVGVLWFQIEATAQQFPEVSEVRFIPEDIFQP